MSAKPAAWRCSTRAWPSAAPRGLRSSSALIERSTVAEAVWIFSGCGLLRPDADQGFQRAVNLRCDIGDRAQFTDARHGPIGSAIARRQAEIVVVFRAVEGGLDIPVKPVGDCPGHGDRLLLTQLGLLKGLQQPDKLGLGRGETRRGPRLLALPGATPWARALRLKRPCRSRRQPAIQPPSSSA